MATLGRSVSVSSIGETCGRPLEQRLQKSTVVNLGVLLLSLPHGVKFPLRLSSLVPNFSVLDRWGDTGNRLPVFFCDPSLPFEPYRVF